MSDKLRSAAERSRYGRSAGCRVDDYDHRLLAEAYLAEHPDDEEEPVTEGWLAGHGFERIEDDGDTHQTWVVTQHWGEAAITVVIEPGCAVCSAIIGDPEDGFAWPYDIHVRGQVHELCRAAGVPLKEKQS